MTGLPEVPYEADEDPIARNQSKRREGEAVEEAEAQANVIAFVFPPGGAEPIQIQLGGSPGQMGRAVQILQEEIGLRTRAMLTQMRKEQEAKTPQIARLGE